MRGTKLFKDPRSGVEVQVSKVVEQLIGPWRISRLVDAVTEMAGILGTQKVYISRAGKSVKITFAGIDTWILPVTKLAQVSHI